MTTQKIGQCWLTTLILKKVATSMSLMNQQTWLRLELYLSQQMRKQNLSLLLLMYTFVNRVGFYHLLDNFLPKSENM